MCTCSPASFLDFFRELARLPLDDGRLDPRALTALMERFAPRPVLPAAAGV